MATSKECEREQRFVATLAASLFRPEEVAAVPVVKHSSPTLPPTLQSYFLQSPFWRSTTAATNTYEFKNPKPLHA